MREAGADCPVVAMKPGNAGGAKGTGHPVLVDGQPREREGSLIEPRCRIQAARVVGAG